MKKVALALFVLLSSCNGAEKVKGKAILEKHSPAIGDKGSLVENIGLETIGGIIPWLENGCSLPCKKSLTFSTAQDGQDQITITLFRGKDTEAQNNHGLGVCRIDVPPAPRATPQIEVTIETAGKEIRISALDKVSSKGLPIQCADKIPTRAKP